MQCYSAVYTLICITNVENSKCAGVYLRFILVLRRLSHMRVVRMVKHYIWGVSSCNLRYIMPCRIRDQWVKSMQPSPERVSLYMYITKGINFVAVYPPTRRQFTRKFNFCQCDGHRRFGDLGYCQLDAMDHFNGPILHVNTLSPINNVFVIKSALFNFKLMNILN